MEELEYNNRLASGDEQWKDWLVKLSLLFLACR